MQSVAQYFGLSNAVDLVWAHRINTPAKLAEAVADHSLHVLEGDVQFGKGDATPLVADGNRPSELDVTTFIATIVQSGKALKLDFHSAAAVEPTLSVLRRLKPTTPVILHADIFTLLSSNSREDSLEPEQFIRMCQIACPHAVLSLGWSLRRAHDEDGRVEDAIIQQLSAMVLQRLGPVNYGIEIRAGYTPNWERGAALILDPLDPQPRTVSNAANVIDIVSRIRRVA